MTRLLKIAVVACALIAASAFGADSPKSKASNTTDAFVTYKQALDWERAAQKDRTENLRWVIGIILGTGVSAVLAVGAWVNRNTDANFQATLQILNQINSKVGSEGASALIEHHSGRSQHIGKAS